MIIPIGEDNDNQILKDYKKRKKSITTQNLMDVRFVPLVEGKSGVLIYEIIFYIFFIIGCESFFYQDYKIKRYKTEQTNDNLYYKVKKGDNLYSISRKFNVTIPKLVNFNNIQTPYRIYPNQKIFIPKKRIYIVKEGETLYAISRRYKTDLFSIAKFNKLKNVNQINANQN